MSKSINVIVMTSGRCDISCSYCYVAATRRNDKMFNVADIETLIHNCSVGFDKVEFCWHGGEPLLAGLGFYRSAIFAQNKENKQRVIEFRNSVQSNGNLLDDFWLEFFDEHNFRLGLSFDAPPDIHYVHRGVDPQQSLRILDKLKKYNFPVGALCVVSKLNVKRGEEIFEFFRSKGVNAYSFLPLRTVPLSTCPPPPTNEELFELYRTTFDLWTSRQNVIVSVEPIETMLRALLGSRPKLCSFAASCPMRMVTIDQEGNVVPCGSLVASEFILGNVLAKPLIEILFGSKAGHFRKLRKQAIKQSCWGCEFVSICRGGCRADAYWHSGRYDGEYPYCGARKMTFEYIRSRLKDILAPPA